MSILSYLHIVNPYNETDLFLLKDYCLKNNSDLYKEFYQIKENYTEIQYKHQEDVNIINRKIFYTLKENEISNLIYVEIEKDTKTANVYPKINSYVKNLIPELSDYLIMNNFMEEVFIFVKQNDIKTATNLIDNDFISLSTGENNEEYIPFLKEKENILESRSDLSNGNIKKY